MHKTLVLVLGIVLLVVLLLAGSLFLVLRPVDASPAHTELEPFTAIDLSVTAADVELFYEDGYAVEYRLHPREALREAAVRDGTLYFDTKAQLHPAAGLDDYYVRITVPRGLSLQSVQIQTVSGDISAAGLNADLFSLDSVSGDLDLTGTLGAVQAKSVSGDLEFLGSISQDSCMETVSGDLEIVTADCAIRAETVGEIEYRDCTQGSKFELPGSGPLLELKSVSGDIELS